VPNKFPANSTTDINSIRVDWSNYLPSLSASSFCCFFFALRDLSRSLIRVEVSVGFGFFEVPEDAKSCVLALEIDGGFDPDSKLAIDAFEAATRFV
jgi:hypothetical protein